MLSTSRVVRLFPYFAALSLLFSSLAVLNITAQGRMSDKDVEKTMDNLKNDAKQLRSDCNSALGKSTIRGTDQEKQFKSGSG